MDIKLYTPNEVGGWLGVEPRTVLRYAREGKLPCTRLDAKNIRFTSEQVEAFISSCSQSKGAVKPVDNLGTGCLPYRSKGGGKPRQGLRSPGFSPTDRQEMKKWR